MLLHILFVMLRFDQNLQKNLNLDLKMKLKKKKEFFLSPSLGILARRLCFPVGPAPIPTPTLRSPVLHPRGLLFLSAAAQ